MKKKFAKKLSLFLVLMLSLSVMLTGCGGPTEGSNEDVAEGTSPEDFKAGFVYIGSANDGGYSQIHDEARKVVEEQLGVKTVYAENVPDSDKAEKAINDLIDQGAKIIFANSFGHMDWMKKAADAHPDVKFMHCSGYTTSENMSSYFGRMYEARYLTGIAAGMQTESNKIGYVAAYAIPEVIRGINAFTLGVKEVNPEATVEVMWTNTWYDPAKEKEAAKALIDKGVDVVTQHQDTTGVQLAAEEAGVQSIGYNNDMSGAAPKAFLTAPVWDWADFYVSQVEAAMNGTWESQAYWGHMSDGVVDLAPFGPQVKEETKAKVEEVKAQILAGDEKVFVGPIKDQQGNVKVEDGVVMTDEEMLGFNWLVEGVVGTLEQ